MKLQVFLTGLLFPCVAALANEPIKPLQAELFDPDKARLGGLLFVDKRLSNDDSLSCASCHKLDQYGVDNQVKSVGIKGTPLKRNTPTVFNSSLNFTQMWDGRLPDLHTRVNKAVTSPALMGMPSWDHVVEKIEDVSVYKDSFTQLYGEVSAINIQQAIAEFQRSLVLLDSPFDKFLQGDTSAINAQAKKGYWYFKDYGCISCHQGANVGGNMFQKMGALNAIDLSQWNNTDVGRFAQTNREWDKYVYKVPSLRLVVHTAPYFHDGSAKTLEDAIDKMTHYQLDRTVPDEHKEAIIAFLHTLPGTRFAQELSSELLIPATTIDQPLGQSTLSSIPSTQPSKPTLIQGEK